MRYQSSVSILKLLSRHIDEANACRFLIGGRALQVQGTRCISGIRDKRYEIRKKPHGPVPMWLLSKARRESANEGDSDQGLNGRSSLGCGLLPIGCRWRQLQKAILLARACSWRKAETVPTSFGVDSRGNMLEDDGECPNLYRKS